MRELRLLQEIFASNALLPRSVTIPPGDDMAGITIGGAAVLATVDQLADGVHFDSALTPLNLIGRKAITRNLSDVAAMAGRPSGALVAGCLPREFGEDRAASLFEAMRVTGEHYGCPLIGGDVSVWDGPLLLTVTILAEPGDVEPVLRSGAKVGDVICVTGQLGGAWPVDGGKGGGGLGAPHLTFEPRVALARELAALEGVELRSMIDLSDGLATDLRHIGRASHVAAEVDVAAVPIRQEAEANAQADGRPAWMHALCDGEDYELCFTVSAEAAARLPTKVDGVTITAVGRITAVQGEDEFGRLVLVHPDGRREDWTGAGWEHGS